MGDRESFFKIGEQIRRLRLEQGLSQRELAEFSGVTLPTLRGIEAGRNTNPTISKLFAIALELEVSVDELLGVWSKAGKQKLRR